jgi:hypothetical protein
MRYYKIEIDGKVWNYLKSKAEPFEDTPNTVLNRILFGDSAQGDFTNKLIEAESSPLTLPGGIPKALSQILEVIYEVRKFNRSRTEATNIVARRRGTAPQTIIDKYSRQLSKKAYEIDELLQEHSLEGFKMLLLNKFDSHQDLIISVFNDLQSSEIKDYPTSRQRKVVEKQTYKEKKMYTLNEIMSLELGKETRPYQMKIDGEIVDVDDWTDLCIHLVERLIEKGFLTDSSVPIFNHSSRREKYFINTRPRHYFSERDAQWKQVGPYFVDTKYNAEAHMKNIIAALYHLNIQNIDFGISFRN